MLIVNFTDISSINFQDMAINFTNRIHKIEKQLCAGDELITVKFHEQSFALLKSELRKIYDEINNTSAGLPCFDSGVKSDS